MTILEVSVTFNILHPIYVSVCVYIYIPMYHMDLRLVYLNDVTIYKFNLGAIWIGYLHLQVCIFWLFFFPQCVNINIIWVHCAETKFTVHGSHSTIHTLKNYFAIVFSVFSFSKNKLYPNGPLMINEKVVVKTEKHIWDVKKSDMRFLW